jgi:Glyoxalase-like domain
VILKRVDHLVYATPDLEASVNNLEKRLGVRAAAGGQHPGRGTRNALLRLGERSYLEIVGPDPSQAWDDTPRWFGIDANSGSRLMTWAANATSLDDVIANANRNGLRLGPVTSGSRMRSDGVMLRWNFTDPVTIIADGLVPFFIDWGRSPHPAVAAPDGVKLVSMRAEHPEPGKVADALSSLGIPMQVDYNHEPSLIAELQTPNGLIELR